MRKKSLLFLVSLACLLSLAFGTITANAALKETSLSSEIVTESGVFNRLDWEKVGENADTVYTENVSDSTYLQWNSNGWGDCWLVAWDPVDFSKGDIYLEFDILAWGGGTAGSKGMFRPVFTNGAITSVMKTIWFGSDGLIDVGAYEGDRNFDWYSDYECTTLYSETVGDENAAVENNNAWYSVAPTGNGTRVRLTFKSDGTLGVQKAAINDDGSYGSYDASTAIYMKTAYPDLQEGSTYYVGLNGQYFLNIDNFKVSYQDGTEVISTDFESADWQELEGVNRPGTILNFKGTMKNDAEYLVTNPANTNMTISKSAVAIDEDVDMTFTLETEVALRNLGKPIGFAFGLADSAQAVDAEGTSFVYFENATVPATEDVAEHIETFVNVMKNGVKGTAVSLGKDITGAAAEFVPVVIDGYKNGDIKVTVNGEAVATFNEQNIEGKVAIATYGTGDVTAAFGIKLSLVTYSYRGSEGSAVATNFNTGYINPENWAMASVKATKFVNADEAVGLTVEDGALFFKGTGDGTYFSSTRAYADYVLEFDYITYHKDDKPEQVEGWNSGHSDLAVNLGCNSGFGWANSIMIMLKQEAGIVQMQNYKGGLSVVEDGDPLPEGTTFNPASAGETVTNKVKITVASNEIKVYLITLQEGVEATADDFVLAATFEVPDTYGIVSFGTTESGYFKIDNVRITPIDDKDPAKVEANLAAYESLQPIADEYRPVTLDAPEVTLSGNVATWTAVEDATGYIINVNGSTTNVGADVLSYTFEQTEPGDYVLTVTAVGNGSYISDSEQSTAVTYTVGSVEKGGAGGCSGNVAGVSIALSGVLAAASVIVLRKRAKKS